MTGSATASLRLTGQSSCFTDENGNYSCTGGNTVIATGGISNTSSGTSLVISGNIGTGRFTVGKTTYDKKGNVSSSETLLDSRADILLSLTIEYNTVIDAATITNADISLASY